MTRSPTQRARAAAHRYAAALRRRRHVRALGDDEPFERLFAVAVDIGITQKPAEIRTLFERVRAERPRRVLEIGLDEGGTLFLWARAAARDGRLVSVDVRPLGRLGAASPFALERRGFARPGQRIHLVMPADSHDEATRRRVVSLFGGEPLDFLFIDGDHSYEGVRRDFELYAPLVRPGGLVAFHDVSPRTTPATEGTARFWRELAAEREVEELVAPGDAGFGIGLLRAPG